MVAPNHPVLEAALKLSPADRLDLAERLVISVADETGSEIEQAWLAESEDRFAAYKRGELPAEPADDFIAALKEGRCP